MSANRAVAYEGPGVVKVIDTDYPDFELHDGPGVNPANVGRKIPHGAILRTVATNICGSDQHMVRGRTTAPAGTRARPRDHRRGRRDRSRRRVHQGRRHRLGALQHLVRPLPQLQGGQDRHLPEREPRPARQRVRLRRHGRMGRRPGRVRARAVRGLEPAALPRPRPGAREDPRPRDAVRHLPDRLPRRGHRRRRRRARPCTSPAPARSVWPQPPARSCSERPS